MKEKKLKNYVFQVSNTTRRTVLEIPLNLLFFFVEKKKIHFFKNYFSFFHNIKGFFFSLEFTEGEAFKRSVATSKAGLAIAP